MYNRLAEEIMGYSDFGYDIIKTTEVVKQCVPEDLIDDFWTVVVGDYKGEDD